MTNSLPVPEVKNWEMLYEPNAKVRCIKDFPPMRGFGRPILKGEVIAIDGVTYSSSYEVAVRSECAFYKLEGYFEVVERENE